jgi:hypothetical protein
MNQIFLTMLTALLGTIFPAPAEGKRMVTNQCKDYDLRTVKPDFACRSSKGNTFRLTHRAEDGSEVWLDRHSGLQWGDKLPERIRRKAAAELCARQVEGRTKVGSLLLNRLPTLAELEGAESRGIREVLPHMKDHFYWIDSSVPGAKNIGHVFNGNVGKPEIVVYRSINFENVRCVGLSEPKIKATDKKPQ